MSLGLMLRLPGGEQWAVSSESILIKLDTVQQEAQHFKADFYLCRSPATDARETGNPHTVLPHQTLPARWR